MLAFDYLDVWPIIGALAQAGGERRVGFNRDDAAAIGGEVRHLPCPAPISIQTSPRVSS